MTVRIDAGQVSFGSTTIQYTLRRSTRRRKTVEIAVDPADGVIVAAPWSATDAEVEGIVQRRAAWIVRRLEAHPNGHRTHLRREWVTGETVLYLGRNYRLRVLNDDHPHGAPVRLTGRWLEVCCGRGRHEIAQAVERWYRERAAKKLAERVAFYAPKVGVQPAQILIRSQTKRWASCSPDGTLRFNWHIVMAPLSIVDYVVVHELCHLRHGTHDRRFWGCLAAVMPDYPVRREILRRDGLRYRLA